MVEYKYSIIGGFFMSSQFGDLIIESVLEMRNQGLTHCEIAKKFNLKQKQIKKLVERYNKKQRLIVAGVKVRKKGRPSKDDKLSDVDIISALKYELNRKEYQIKSLEMKNKLMRDFLHLTGRK